MERIIYIAQEFPLPASHGGRVDTWTRLKALSELGAEILFISWYVAREKKSPGEEDLFEVKKYVSDIITYPIPKDLKRIVRLIKFPSPVAARVLSREDLNSAVKRCAEFGGEFVFIDGLFSAQTGLEIARTLNLKTSLRSHNIEHLYISGQLGMAKNLKSKLAIYLSTLHLRSFEFDILKKVNLVFDISMEDMKFWKSNGYHNFEWLPSIYVAKPSNASSTLPVSSECYFQLCFFGNLYSPNNVNGLIWFIEEVYPLLKTYNKNIKVLIMGSNPSAELLNRTEREPLITVLANPKDLSEGINNSSILINPVRFSSGVNIKAIEMLFYDNPVVSTSFGIKGMPEQVRKVFHIADSGQDFANKIINILEHPSPINKTEQHSLQDLFGKKAITQLLQKIRNLTKS